MERLHALGPDLAATHFIISRGCKVRFHGHKNWTEVVWEWGRLTPSYPDYLPTSYDPSYYVSDIDVSDSKLTYEGLTSMRMLISLKHLNLSYW